MTACDSIISMNKKAMKLCDISFFSPKIFQYADSNFFSTFFDSLYFRGGIPNPVFPSLPKSDHKNSSMKVKLL